MALSLPVLFLVFALISAAFTANVFRPLWGPAWPAVFSFFFGWLTAELALHHVAWQVAVAALFVVGGAAQGPVGLAALVVLAASWIGLAISHQRARRTQSSVLRTLSESLGPDYEDELLPEMRHFEAPALPLANLIHPFRIRRADVEVDKDRVFHEETTAKGRLRLRLDVFRPRQPGTKRPMMIYVHGGAWVLGKKEHQGLPLLNLLAAHGWVCVSISYRLSPRATFPDHIIDVKRAIAWTRAHAEELGGDPDFIAISGGSAGGHLASLAALTPNERQWQPGFEGADTRVQACVGIYGIYDFLDRFGLMRNGSLQKFLAKHVLKSTPQSAPELWRSASPQSHVNAEAPPFLLVHGTHDTLAPIAPARRFADALRDVSSEPVVLTEFPGAQHAFEIFPSVRTAIALDATERFLGFVYSVHQRRQTGRGASA